jgi:hypothetical protein
MIILEEPYVSEMLIRYLEENNIPVLENAFAKQLANHRLNLKSEFDFIGKYVSSKKIYTVSEYALDWVTSTLNDSDLNRQITLLKNKVAFRDVTRQLYPDFFFQELSFTELFSFDTSAIQYPFVLKPAVGFLSTGVFPVFNDNDWKIALDELLRNFNNTENVFPDVVVDRNTFIIESYIKGKEFAIDLYFHKGEPVIINIFEHPFSSEKDVSDKLYFTNKEIFDNYLMSFTAYMSRLNKELNLDSIPVHVELRVDGENIIPIEINPLRFTGMCLNEIGFYIAGQHPLHFYFTNSAPDYSNMWKGKENSSFYFSIIEKPNFQKNSFAFESFKYDDSNIGV